MNCNPMNCKAGSFTLTTLAGLLLLACTPTASASDACSTRAVVTSADVTVSDGTSFQIRSFFQSKETAAIQHIREPDQLVVVEGPFGWARAGGVEKLGGGFYKTFALGHQYHAFLLYFDELVANPRDSSGVMFQGRPHRARSGDYPYGGEVHLLISESGQRPPGMIFDFPEAGQIVVSLSDWRSAGEVELPYAVSIDDGERVFEYRYQSVDLASRPPSWFAQAVGTPELDEVQVYRLHRQLLAAHCLGDADMIARLSAGQILSANNGALQHYDNAALWERFSGLFEQLDYTAYHDIQPPVVEISESGDLGWIGVNVRAVGQAIESGTPFESQWAWLMVVRKEGGVWRHAGNASNRAQ